MTLESSGTRQELLHLLRQHPGDDRIAALIQQLEIEQPADLSNDSEMLEGIWTLCWSSSKQPWLKQSSWLENLQVLDPAQKRGCNILRLQGPLRDAGGIRVDASLALVDHQRVHIQFKRGGWVGPQVAGLPRLELMRSVKQTFPAWLDITVLDETLRICRGNAGTTFALLRISRDLPIDHFFNS